MKLRHLLLGRKAMTNSDNVLNSRDITLPTKVHIVKAMVFPVVMYGYETWTIKKAEHLRTDAFQRWSWRRRLRVLWTVRSSNQIVLKEINPEYSLEGLILKLKLQYFGYLMWRADSLEKILMLRKIEGKRRDEVVGWHMSLSKLWEIIKDRQALCATVHRLTKSWTRLSDWTTNKKEKFSSCQKYDVFLGSQTTRIRSRE